MSTCFIFLFCMNRDRKNSCMLLYLCMQHCHAFDNFWLIFLVICAAWAAGNILYDSVWPWPDYSLEFPSTLFWGFNSTHGFYLVVLRQTAPVRMEVWYAKTGIKPEKATGATLTRTSHITIFPTSLTSFFDTEVEPHTTRCSHKHALYSCYNFI